MTNTLPKDIQEQFLEDCKSCYNTSWHHFPFIVLNLYEPGFVMTGFAVGKEIRTSIAQSLRKLNELLPDGHRDHFIQETNYGLIVNNVTKAKIRFRPATGNRVRGLRDSSAILAYGIDMNRKAWRETMDSLEAIRMMNIPIYEHYLTK